MELLCPIAAQNESPLAQACRYFEERTQRLLQECWSGGKVDVGQVEEQVADMVHGLGRQIICAALQGMDPGTPQVKHEGQVLKLVHRGPKNYLTRFGEVTVEHGLYRPPGHNPPTVCPLDATAGIIEGYWTPGAARLAALLGAELTTRDAQRFSREAGMAVSTASLGRLVTALARTWEVQREVHEAALRESITVPVSAKVICASVDGVHAPMRDKSAARQTKRAEAGKHGSGPSGYREVGCGTIAFYDREVERLHTIYHARMPEAKKATLGQMMQDEMVHIAGRRPDLRRVYLADGADINWQIAASIEAACQPQDQAAGRIGPAAVEIVDFYHACEHLKRACDAALGDSTIASKVEFQKLKTKLKEADDGVERVIDALRYRRGTVTSRRKHVAAELTYFRNQRARMHYAEYRRQGLPIASGVVEAACKTLVTQRLKRSGMAWSQTGGQAVLNLRCWLRSDRFELAWHFLSNSYKDATKYLPVSLPTRLKLVA